MPHVCVVGAGVAGLRCADILLQHGVRVTVLEARNRVGGRLCQSKVHGNLVDLGPNWIHGTSNNPFIALAEETKTPISNPDEEQAAYDQHGNRIPGALAADLSTQVWNIIAEAFKHSDANSSSIPPEKSLRDFFEDRLAAEGVDEDRRGQVLRFADMWGAFVGSPIQRQSLKFFWLEECIEGENLFVAGTYEKMLAKVAKPALDAGAITFGKKVRRVISTELGQSSPVVVETADGAKAEFDEIVLTTPLGWLKEHKDVFSPLIPSRLDEAINSIGYGALDKVYITFETAYWNSDDPSRPVPLTTSPEPVPNMIANKAAAVPQSPTSDSSSSSSLTTQYPGFTHWMTPTYAHATNPEGWCQESMNMAALPPPCAHPSLLFYIFADTSRHVSSLIASAPDTSAADDAVLRFFEPYYSRLPNYSAESPDCKPMGVLATNWVADELAGHGSYSNFQTGSERLDEDIEVIRHGMPDRKVWLAGEHTAPFVALGTVTGAYWSGEGVSRRILEAYGMEIKDGVMTDQQDCQN